MALGTSPASAALAALWRFEVNGGSQADSSANGNTATSVGGAVQVLDTIRASGAMEFDGINDFLTVADSSSLSITGTNMTIAFWMKLDTVGGIDQWRGIVAKDPAGSGNPAPYQLWFNQGNAVPGFGRGDGTVTDFAFGNSVPVTGVWEHWAIVQNATLVTMYKNGVAIGMSDNTISTTITDQNGSLIIGDRPGAQDMSFDGRLDDLAIFNEALTADQIATISSGDFSSFGVVPEPGAACIGSLAAAAALSVRRRRARQATEIGH